MMQVMEKSPIVRLSCGHMGTRTTAKTLWWWALVRLEHLSVICWGLFHTDVSLLQGNLVIRWQYIDVRLRWAFITKRYANRLLVSPGNRWFETWTPGAFQSDKLPWSTTDKWNKWFYLKMDRRMKWDIRIAGVSHCPKYSYCCFVVSSPLCCWLLLGIATLPLPGVWKKHTPPRARAVTLTDVPAWTALCQREKLSCQ